MIIEKKGIEITIENAFDLILEYYNEVRIGIKPLGTNRWLRDIKNVKPGVRRMFYHVQHYLVDKQIDITKENKNEFIIEFLKEWRKKDI